MKYHTHADRTLQHKRQDQFPVLEEFWGGWITHVLLWECKMVQPLWNKVSYREDGVEGLWA